MLALLLTTLLSSAAPRPDGPQSACVSRDAVRASARDTQLPKGRWAPEVYARLVRVLADYGAESAGYDPCARPLAVFDWDNTMIAGDIGDAAFQDAAEQGLLRVHPRLLEPLDEPSRAALQAASTVPERRYAFHAAYEALCKARGPEVCYPWLTETFHGHAQDTLAVFAHGVIERALARPYPTGEQLQGAQGTISLQRAVRPRPEMKSLVETLRAHGFDVFVVTASPEWLVQRFAPQVTLGPDHVVGVRTVTSTRGEEGVVARQPVTYRQGKVTAIRTRIAPGGRRPVLALGDALTDREMLEDATGLAVLVDRGNEGLRAFAAAKGFAIQPVFEDLERGEGRGSERAVERRAARRR